VLALSKVDLTLETGEVVALVGRSGCGKTTLLRTIAGLTPPSAGQVLIDGRDVWDGARSKASAREGLAVVFQEANLLPWLNVEANIGLPLRLRRIRRAERLDRAREMCELTGLTGFERHRPAALSVGMRQRAALARALIESPRILLLDEPFAALDAITRESMNLEIQRVWAERPGTWILVTHSIIEAVLLADRVVTLTARPGRVAGITEVPFVRPRPIDLQHGAAFQSLVREVRSLLPEEP
jgi:NitT/TauT family transport system ATP-binding protein